TAAETAGLGDIYERSFAGVLQKVILADAGDQNIGVAVVVVIADGHAHSIKLDVDTGGFGDGGKSAIAIVAVKLECGAAALVARPVHRIDQQDVLVTVAVVVEKGAAGTQ